MPPVIDAFEMDACPDEITDPQIRSSWNELTPVMKTIILNGIASGRTTPTTNTHQVGAPPPIQTEDGHYTPGGLAEDDDDTIIDPQLVEDTVHSVTPAPQEKVRSCRNAVYAARGGIVGRRNIHQSDAELEGEANDEPFAPDPDAMKDDSNPLDLALLRLAALDETQKTARLAIAKVVCRQFREVTQVPEGSEWPKWGEPMPGMSVNFEAHVDQSVNEDLLVRVAEVSMQQLKKCSAVHAHWMNAPNVKLTHGLLCEFGKKTFRGFKSQYAAQFSEEKAREWKNNARNSQWQSRRNTKCANLMSVAENYKERNGVDPTHLLGPDMMSDEASGPEDDGEEAVVQWKREMAAKAGISGRSDAELKKMSFFEVVKPNWRSDELSKILHDLWDLFWETVSSRAARTMTTRVRDTGRSSDKIPLVAPYNFGINVEWYERVKVTHRQMLCDWFKYEDPTGFGSKQASPRRRDSTVAELSPAE
ncbi:hypothetical protein LXA43DRAFT_977826 [Ganoderma leucocontextum]|nr:hypothetical protein LXA43DRAFT_977826 [Ganoderma leucocontextum]